MSLVEHYLAIERARFGAKLQLSCDLSPEMRHHPVPAFLVQTLVENAIKHGLEKRRQVGSLTITISKAPSLDGSDSTEAQVVIQDSGVGIPALFGKKEATSEALPFFGIGLTNVSERLHQLFERDDLMHFMSDPETGTTVSVILPLNRTN